jgi:hypothetical protein
MVFERPTWRRSIARFDSNAEGFIQPPAKCAFRKRVAFDRCSRKKCTHDVHIGVANKNQMIISSAGLLSRD